MRDIYVTMGGLFQCPHVRRWRSQQDCLLDKYNFGIYGCWIRDDKGNLDYINEEDYTEDLWEEQQKVISRNSGMKR